MNQLLFEGRSLVGIVSSIVRQDTMRVMYSRLDWERMYRIADYHNVSNIVYLGVLGKGDILPDKWRERFFERYQEALFFGEYCEEALKEVLTWLDMKNISCTVLTSQSVRNFYKIQEAAANSPLQILMDHEKFYLARGYLIDLGYEVEQTYDGYGERLNRVSGVPVVLYYKLPFRTLGYARGMARLLEDARLKEPFHYIRELSVESEYLFRIAGAVYRYVTDELTLREMLDLYLCHQTWRDELNREQIQKRLTDIFIDDLAEKMLRISYMWFGDKKDDYFTDQPEDMSVYDTLEDRLLTKGIINNERNEQALRLRRMIQREIDKERRREERKQFSDRMQNFWERVRKKLEWLFPDYHYMASIYPAVERIPILLPVFWIFRCLRLIWKVLIK